MIFSFDVFVGQSELLRVIVKRVIAELFNLVDGLGFVYDLFEIDIFGVIRQLHHLLINK